MAEDHVDQDNPTAQFPKAAKPTDAAPTPGDAFGHTGIALLLLGVNAWATSVGWTLLSADAGMGRTLLASAALWPLIAGIWLQQALAPARRVAARWLLLCAYPAALSAGLCLGSEAARERAHTPLTMLLAAASLLVYMLFATQACRTALSLLCASTRARAPLRATAATPRRARDLAVALLLVGACAIAWGAPLLPSYAEVEAAFGAAAPAGAVLAAVTGGALASAIVSLYVGALLQPAVQSRVSARQRRNRIATWLLSALFGAVVYFSVVR